jgi:CubicO group peptidase (beta-lactamase class C family)
MGSVTKTLVGTAMLKLQEQGLLNIREKLTDCLPDFHMKDPLFRHITLEHLLSHTSGMPDVVDYRWDRPETDEGALERYVFSDEVINSRLLWPPGGGRFSYSNMAYEILGLIIARRSSMTFEECIKEIIFKPLEMNDSTLLTYQRDMTGVCAPHKKNDSNDFEIISHFPYNRAHGPSSTLTSSASDLGKWAKAHIQKSFLSPPSYAIAFKPRAIIPNNKEQMCLSWFRRIQNGYVFFGHEGTDDGFRASFWFCPKLHLSIVVCSNLSKAPVKRISIDLFDLLSEKKAER